MIDEDIVISKEIVSTLRKINGHLCFHPDGRIKLKMGNLELVIKEYSDSKIELSTLLQAVKDSFECERGKSLFNTLKRALNGKTTTSKKPE